MDCNVRALNEDDWAWADVVMLTAMIVQRDDFRTKVQEAKARGKPVVVGGPYVTSLPNEAEEAGADYIVLDEGEITIPPLLELVSREGFTRRAPGAPARMFGAGDAKPEVTGTPIARFDLLDFGAYDAMAIQYSRGCPFLCEFCDIITLYGRRPRTKTPAQVLAELDRLLELGWRGGIFLVDDNFIGNKKNVKKLLAELKVWQNTNGYPFWFDTEASIDLAADDELLRLMRECSFNAVFIGIETPDADSLELTRKHQNNRSPMVESVQKITRSGLRVMTGLIIGFDNEKPGADKRIVDFVEQTAIPTALLSMLQVLPNTGLHDRLKKEGRLGTGFGTLNGTSLLNFVPTRPVEEIALEYLAAYDQLYDPVRYLDRCHRCFLELGRDAPRSPGLPKRRTTRPQSRRR